MLKSLLDHEALCVVLSAIVTLVHSGEEGQNGNAVKKIVFSLL